MRNLIVIMALALVSFSAQAQSKIGTIDADYVLAQMPEIDGVNKGLEAYNLDLQKDLDSTITKYETLVEAYKANSTTWAEEERKAKESDLISLENDIKSFRQKASVMLQMKRNELTEPLYEKINDAMLAVIKQEGFTQILHAGSTALAYSEEGSDITLKVLEKLGIKINEAAAATGSK